MSISLRGMMAIGLILVLAGVARSADLIVDQKNARADDKNPGTLESPFKTIQAAVDKAQPGDTVQVRGGVYHESVKFTHGGTNYKGMIISGDSLSGDSGVKFITLEAYKDEHVVLDGSVAIPADNWKLVEGRKHTYSTPFDTKKWSPPNMVWAKNTMLKPAMRENPDPKTHEQTPMIPDMPGDGPADEGWYYDKTQQTLFVNMGGRAPGTDIWAPLLCEGVNADNQSYVRIRKLEIRNFTDPGIRLCEGHEFRVEDNYIHHCRLGIFGSPNSGCIIRRNTVANTLGDSMGLLYARGTIVEGNVIRGFHGNAAIVCNNAFGLVIRNNIIVGADVGNTGYGFGIWPDCGAFGIAIYGNTIYRTVANACYIEAGAQSTSLYWNTVFDCNGAGIFMRANSSNTAFENYVFGNHSGQGSGITIAWCCGGCANMMMRNWVIDNDGAGAVLSELQTTKFAPPDPSRPEGTAQVFKFNPDPPKSTSHVLDHNVYKLRPDSVLLRYEGKPYKDLASVRSELGQEMHGEVVTKFDPAPLGLVTFRVPGTKKSWEPVPMFGNPHGARWAPLPLEALYQGGYFWKQGTFRRVELYGWRYDPLPAAGAVSITRDNCNGFFRVMDESCNDFPGHARPDGNGTCCYLVRAMAGKTMSADGLAYWSVDLPTLDGAQIDLALWIRAHEIKPVNGNGGLFALAEFCDETGQNVTRQFLAGADDGQKAVGAEWVSGTYAYKKLSGMVTAPKGARWFKLGFGLRNCSGWAAFDEMDIQTRPGTPEKEAPKAPPPIDAAQFGWTPCDLTGLLNRPLADEVDNDGKGGWTDQGPTMDLRDLRAGDCVFNNVAFRVAEGKACFIMKNKMRPSENLPADGKMDVKGKADVLAFLHSGGWLTPGVRHATYVIHYADGQKIEIPMIAGKNIFDWTTPPTALEGLKYDPTLGFTQHATAVAVPAFVFGHLWMTLWKNPHPDKQIVSLEVKGANEGIPGLIAVSRGLAK